MISRRSGVMRVAGLDVIGPLVVYRVCRNAGLPEVWSLVVSGCLPGLGVALDWVRWRTLEVVGLVVLGGIALSVALALIADDARLLLLEGAAITGAFALACFASLTLRRPLIFYFGQALYGGRHTAAGAELDQDYVRYAEARSYWRVVTIVWGVAQLMQSVVLVVVVLSTPTATALTYSRTVPWVVAAALTGWAVWWGERLRAEKPDDEV